MFGEEIGVESGLKFMLEDLEQAKVDAGIYIYNRTCPIMSAIHRIINDTIKKRFGIMTLVQGIDIMDLRPETAGDMQAQFEEFMNLVEASTK